MELWVPMLAAVALGVLLTVVACRLVVRSRLAQAEAQAEAKWKASGAVLEERLRAAEALARSSDEAIAGLRAELRAATAESNTLRAEAATLVERVSTLQANADALAAANEELSRLQSERAALLESGDNFRVTVAEREKRIDQLTALADRLGHELANANETMADLRASAAVVGARLDSAESRVQESAASLQQEREARVALELELGTLRVTESELRTVLQHEREQGTEKLALLAEARESLSDQFKQLANEILEEKSKRFVDQNQTNLSQLLDPLRERIREFQSKVEETHVNDTRDRSALLEQVKSLTELNRVVGDEARNLVSALKGANKTQGTWGEMILERVLESSGLQRGREYDVQESFTRDDGTRVQPDVVVKLPGDRFLVIDAKVSLTAFEEYVSSDDELQRASALHRHCESVRAHIRGLSGRKYEELHGAKSLDCVLMFVAIEPAFMTSLAHDQNVILDAWGQNVLLVSPSTLLYALRTIAHLWNQENQSQNAQEIARRGALLYDKIAAFVDDLEKVGDRLTQARDPYDLAMGKLSSGRGNVLRQVEMLRDLGVKPTKRLPERLALSGDEDEIPADALLLSGPAGSAAAVPLQ